jgi:O-acetyl-ADP-ribose deacetylase (regulator of RNase III)
MIEYVQQQNVLDSDCEAIVNTVNCYGKMGKGLALLYKRKFPQMFLAYKRACDEGKVKTGTMHLWKNPNGGWVINFPTKDHWRNPSQMEWIVLGLQNLVEVIKDKDIKSIAIPPLGCGLGGLEWYRVRGEIKRVHDHHWKDIRVVVYEP